MENLIMLENVEASESLLKGRLFTGIQYNIIRKRLQRKQLDSNEQTYYYKFIRPKLKAMMVLFNIGEINVRGKERIIPGRVAEAAAIIKMLERKHKKKKIIISGSFLFNERYSDIDAFIFTKYDKEDYRRGSLHANFLPESALDSLFFSSLCQVSVSNFNYAARTTFDIKLSDLLQTYELLISSMLNKEDYENSLRDFLLNAEYVSRGVVLNPEQLYCLKEKLLHKNAAVLSNVLVDSLVLSYTSAVLKEKLAAQIRDYRRLFTEYRSARNLPVYIDTYSKVIELAT